MFDADDPIAFEPLGNAIFSIADAMALTIFRTTCSGVLKDNMDCSTEERRGGRSSAAPVPRSASSLSRA